jgi:hypothetical protein
MHHLDLRLLRGDDVLGQLPQRGILAIGKLDLRHVNGTLMVRNHPADEIDIGIAAVAHLHALMHFFHGAMNALVDAVSLDFSAAAPAATITKIAHRAKDLMRDIACSYCEGCCAVGLSVLADGLTGKPGAAQGRMGQGGDP